MTHPRTLVDKYCATLIATSPLSRESRIKAMQILLACACALRVQDSQLLSCLTRYTPLAYKMARITTPEL